jgi:hypothetical protein
MRVYVCECILCDVIHCSSCLLLAAHDARCAIVTVYLRMFMYGYASVCDECRSMSACIGVVVVCTVSFDNSSIMLYFICEVSRLFHLM